MDGQLRLAWRALAVALAGQLAVAFVSRAAIATPQETPSGPSRIDHGPEAAATLDRIHTMQTEMAKTCAPNPEALQGRKADTNQLTACKTSYQGSIAALEKIYELQAFLDDKQKCATGLASNAAGGAYCPSRTGFSTIAEPIYVQTSAEPAKGNDQQRTATTPSTAAEAAKLSPPNTLAMAYLDQSGAPMSLDAYDWRTCSAATSAAASPPAPGHTTPQGFGGWLQAILANTAVASDEYALAYQSSCNPNSSLPVPNDPIYANSGVLASASYNSFTTSKVGGQTKIVGSGSGKVVGAVGIDLVPLARDIPLFNGIFNQLTDWTKVVGAHERFCENCHYFPYVGIDYEFTQKATGPGRVGLSNSTSVRQLYYGIAFNNTLVIDWLFGHDRPGFNCPTDTDLVYRPDQPNRDQNGYPTIYAPGKTVAGGGGAGAQTDDSAPSFNEYWPAPVALAHCVDYASGKTATDSPPVQKDYYVWERIDSLPQDYLNFTSDLFVLKDRLTESKILALNARVVPFHIFDGLLGDYSIGLNEYNRPPIYLGTYTARHITNDPTGKEQPCAAGKFCGLDWDPADTRIALVADIRFDGGHFVERGAPQSDPTLTEDYVRLGGRVGAVVEINLLRNNPIALQATYLDYWPIIGFRNSLGLVQFEADYVLPNFKGLTLALSYENGRNQDTAQRVEDWTVSLKYAPAK